MKDSGVDIAWLGHRNPRILMFEENRHLCFMSFWMINSPNVGLITGFDFPQVSGILPSECSPLLRSQRMEDVDGDKILSPDRT